MQKSKDIDIGSLLLANPFKSFYEVPEQSTVSTGFMGILKTLLKGKVKQQSVDDREEGDRSNTGNTTTTDNVEENTTKSKSAFGGILADSSSSDEGDDYDDDAEEEAEEDEDQVVDYEDNNSSSMDEEEDGDEDNVDEMANDDIMIRDFANPYPTTNAPVVKESKQIHKVVAATTTTTTAKTKTTTSTTKKTLETVEFTGGFIKFDALGSDMDEDADEPPPPPKRNRPQATREEEARRRKMSNRELSEYLNSLIGDLTTVSYTPEWVPKRQGPYQDLTFPRILHNEIKDFVKYMSPTREEHRLRSYVCKLVESVITKVWPEATVEIFGSFNTQIYLPSSDLDLVVFCDTPGGIINHNLLAKNLKQSGVAEPKSVQIIKARVPIVKFVSAIGHFSIDISFNVDGGPKAAHQITGYLKDHPALKPLTMVLKQFLQRRGLNEVFLGGLGSYALVTLLLSFLQHYPKLQTGEIREEENLGVLLIDFLDLFGRRFNYNDVGIGVDKGGYYFAKNRNEYRYMSLTLLDPQDLTNDISRGSFNMKAIVRSFGRAHDILVASMFEHEDRYFETKANDPSKAVRSTCSILATIVDLDEGLVASRKFVKETYNALKSTVEGVLVEGKVAEPRVFVFNAGKGSPSESVPSSPSSSNSNVASGSKKRKRAGESKEERKARKNALYGKKRVKKVEARQAAIQAQSRANNKKKKKSSRSVE